MVAIDWPGHGLSSPRPAGELYDHISMVVDMKYVIEGTYVCGIVNIVYIHIKCNMCTQAYKPFWYCVW